MIKWNSQDEIVSGTQVLFNIEIQSMYFNTMIKYREKHVNISKDDIFI